MNFKVMIKKYLNQILISFLIYLALVVFIFFYNYFSYLTFLSENNLKDDISQLDLIYLMRTELIKMFFTRWYYFLITFTLIFVIFKLFKK